MSGRVLARLLTPVLLLVVVWSCSSGPRPTLTLATPSTDWWTMAPLIVNDRKSFADAGLDLKTVDVSSGLASKNAVVAGTADVGLTAATPLVTAAGRNESVAVLGSYLSANLIVGLAVPKGAPTTGAPPEPIAVVPGTISEWYLYSWLAKRNLQDLMTGNTLKRLELRPPDVVPSVMSHSAKSAVIWEPFLSTLKGQPDIEVRRDPDVQTVKLFIITRPATLATKRDAIVSFLRGFDAACQFITGNRPQARSQLEKHFSFSSEMLEDAWADVKYGLDQEVDPMKKAILGEADIAVKLKRVSSVPAVDYMFPPETPKLR